MFGRDPVGRRRTTRVHDFPSRRFIMTAVGSSMATVTVFMWPLSRGSSEPLSVHSACGRQRTVVDCDVWRRAPRLRILVEDR